MDHSNSTIQKCFFFSVTDVAGQRNEEEADHAAAIVNVLQDHHVADHRDVVHDHLHRKSNFQLFFSFVQQRKLFLIPNFSYRHRSPSPRPFRRGRTPPNGLGDRSPPEDLSPEERDARTVFCMQLSQRIRSRDLEEFFSSVGKVRDIRLITCNKTKRFKGIAYIEFKDPESVPLVS